MNGYEETRAIIAKLWKFIQPLPGELPLGSKESDEKGAGFGIRYKDIRLTAIEMGIDYISP